MKSLKSVILASAMLAGFASVSQAADPAEPPVAEPQDYSTSSGFYLRGDIGWSFLEWGGGDDDNAPTAGIGAGYQATEYLRGDVRLDWAGTFDVAPGANMDMTTLLGNMYFDIPNETVFTPYVGAGLGYGWVSDAPVGDSDGFAYSLMAGSSVDLSDSMMLDFGYRFRNIDIDGADAMDHSFTTGLRVKF